MRLRALLVTVVAIALGAFVYKAGLWEPLRTVVVTSVGGLIAAAALLANARARQLRPRSLAYLEIAIGTAGLVALHFAARPGTIGTASALVLGVVGGIALGAAGVLALHPGLQGPGTLAATDDLPALTDHDPDEVHLAPGTIIERPDR
jgi:predicted acyltransferase